MSSQSDLEPCAHDLEAVADLDDPRWRTALRTVLDGQGLDVVAQPIVDVAHARVGGYELLSRFAGPPTRSPDVWFTAARRHGLDAELTALTVTTMRALAEERPPATFWSMNIEPHLLTSTPVSEALLAHGRLDQMVVELTEHVDSRHDGGLDDVLAEVRRLGGRIAMDDAGTGYSGLSQMLTIRPDIVKIDRSLVSGLDRDPVRRTVVRLLGDLSGQIDSWLLAEGVETWAELDDLLHLGVPLVQGWATGRPAAGWPGLVPELVTHLDRHAVRADLGDHVLPLVRPARVHRTVGPHGDQGPGGTCLPAPLGDHGPAPGEVVLDGRGGAWAVVVTGP
ncbi:diguanylate phosphodiesterase, partial [Cellulomonas bogoriensis 69B4 = DSM 16987]